MRSGNLRGKLYARQKLIKEKANVDRLLHLGVNPNLAKDIAGNTVLHVAALSGSEAIADYMVYNGIDPAQKNENNENAYTLAAKRSSEFKSLLEKSTAEFKQRKDTHAKQIDIAFKKLDDAQYQLSSAIKLDERKIDITMTPKLIADIKHKISVMEKSADEAKSTVDQAESTLPKYVVSELTREYKYFHNPFKHVEEAIKSLQDIQLKTVESLMSQTDYVVRTLSAPDVKDPSMLADNNQALALKLADQCTDLISLIQDTPRNAHAETTITRLAQERDRILNAWLKLDMQVITGLKHFNEQLNKDHLTVKQQADNLQQQKELETKKLDALVRNKLEETATLTTEAAALCEKYHVLKGQIPTAPNFMELKQPMEALQKQTEEWIKKCDDTKAKIDLSIKSDVKIDLVITTLDKHRDELSKDIHTTLDTFSKTKETSLLAALKHKSEAHYVTLRNSLVKKINALSVNIMQLKQETEAGSGATVRRLHHLILSLHQYRETSAVNFVLQLGRDIFADAEIFAAQECLRETDRVLLQAVTRYNNLTHWLKNTVTKPDTLYTKDNISTTSTDFHQSAYNGAVKDLRTKLQARREAGLHDLNSKDSRGRTAFMLATANDQQAAIHYLHERSNKTQKAEHKLRLNEKDNLEQTAIMLAARKNHENRLTHCLSYNTPEKRKAWQKNVIEVFKKECKTDLNKLYEDHQMMNIEAKDKEGMTAFMRSIVCHRDEKINANILDAFLNEISEHNACIKEIDNYATRTLEKTAAEEIKHGADSHYIKMFDMDNLGRTAFHLACAFGTKSAVQKLLGHTLEVEGIARIQTLLSTTDAKGYTPLMLAAACGRQEIVEELIKDYKEYRVNINQVDPFLRFTAWDFSIHHRKILNRRIEEDSKHGSKVDTTELQALHHRHSVLERMLNNAGMISTIKEASEDYLEFIENPMLISLPTFVPVAYQDIPPPPDYHAGEQNGEKDGEKHPPAPTPLPAALPPLPAPAATVSTAPIGTAMFTAASAAAKAAEMKSAVLRAANTTVAIPATAAAKV